MILNRRKHRPISDFDDKTRRILTAHRRDVRILSELGFIGRCFRRFTEENTAYDREAQDKILHGEGFSTKIWVFCCVG